MKKIFYLLLTSILLIACKNSNTPDNALNENVEESAEEVLDELDLIAQEQEKILENAYFYVMVPNGLSLRKLDQLDSEKITTMPYGSKVKQTSAIYTVDMTVENIPGSMMEINYNGDVGYAFNGYLSAFPMPKKDEQPEDYIKSIKEQFPNASFSQKDTPEDFHDGYINEITLPTSSWHEAFYTTMALCHIPKSFGFPGLEGDDKEIISEKNPEEGTWTSDLTINRTNNSLEQISYSYRTEGYGVNVAITEGEDNLMHIEYLVFVD